MKYRNTFRRALTLERIHLNATRYLLHGRIGESLIGSLICGVSLAIILLVDYFFTITSPNLFMIATLDQLAHVGTAAMFLVILARWINKWLLAGCLLGATLIDVDHIPILLSTSDFSAVAGRPVTHSLIVALILASTTLLVRGAPRHLITGAVLGVATHLFRDAGTGGIPLLWPVTGQTFVISYVTYVAPLVAFTLLPGLIHAVHAVRHTRAGVREKQADRCPAFETSKEHRS